MFSQFSNNGYQRFNKWSIIDPTVFGYFGQSATMSGDGQFVVISKTSPLGFFCYNGWTGALRYTFSTPTVCNSQFTVISPDGRYVMLVDTAYASGNGRVYIFNTADGTLKTTIDAYNPENISGVGFAGRGAFSYDGSILAIASSSYKRKNINFPTTGQASGAVHLYNVETGARITSIAPPYFNYNSPENAAFGEVVSLSFDGTRLVTTAPFKDSMTFQGQAYLYDATNGTLLQTYNPPAPIAFNVYGIVQDIARDKQKIYFGDYGQTVGGTANAGCIRVCSATTGALLNTFNNPLIGSGVLDFGGFVQTVADGTTLITTARIGTTRIWLSVNAETGGNPQILTSPEMENLSTSNYGYVAKADLFGRRLLLTNPFLRAPYLDQGGAYVYDISFST